MAVWGGTGVQWVWRWRETLGVYVCLAMLCEALHCSTVERFKLFGDVSTRSNFSMSTQAQLYLNQAHRMVEKYGAQAPI